MPCSGRTPLFRDVRRAFHAARYNNALRSRSDATPRSLLTRRNLLKTSMAAIAAAYANGGRVVFAQSGLPRIVVVGAGIAGLNATYLLQQAGFNVTLYEGSSHIGGRIQTNRNGAAPNVYTELGGEFIDSSHEDMLSLADQFGLDLIDTQAASEDGLEVAYYANGRLRSEAEVIAAFEPLAAIVDQDSAYLSDDISYSDHSRFDVHLDRTDLRAYLARNVREGWLFDILEAAYVNEFGLELEDQSTLNFVETIGTDTSNGFEIYGESDQRYKIRGGNDQIVQNLAQRVNNRLVLDHRLVALDRTSGGRYRLTFQTGSGLVGDVTADIVLLCLPFTILRNIDLRLQLPPLKRRVIRELGYGTNAKVILGFTSRVWRTQGFGGDSYADLPYQSGWDGSREQDAPSGAYTLFAGGTAGLSFGKGSALDQGRHLLRGLDRVFPGVQDAWRGTSVRAFWPDNPFVRASYACYRPGQWTSLRGTEGLPVENLYFAGEHTSLDWQGYMNGGAESGRLAAEAIIARFR